MFIQFLIVFSIAYFGEIVSRIFSLPIPGTITGMLLLFILLCTGVLKLKFIERAADLLIINMVIFFIPPGVSLVSSIELLKGNWIKVVILMTATTIITMAVTGLVVQYFIRRGTNGRISK